MKGVFKCGLFVALFAVLSTVLFTGSSASANTPNYDIMLETTNVLDIPSYCDPELRLDFSSNYKELITEGRHWQYGGEDVKQAQFRQAYSESENGGGIMWLKNMDNVIQAIYSPTGLEFDWTQVPGEVYVVPKGGGQNLYRSDFQSVMVNFGCQISSWQSTKEWQVAIGHEYGENGNENIKIFASIGDVNPNYPEGYSGVDVPGAPEAGATAHKPNITWSVNDKDVILYSDDAKNTAVLDDYQIYWFISNTTFSTVQPTEPFALSGCTPPDYNNNFTVPIHYDYGVQAYYADEDCNILQVDDEGNRLSDNMEVLTIDGSTFDGSTTDHEAIIGEVEDNAILKAIRKFRPNDGGLAGLIYAPIEAVATLPTIVGSCSPITLPLLGEEVSLECIRPTIQASPMGAVYNTISVIITGIVTWWVAWKTFGTIKGIQDPQDDRVEVLKL